jgi:hypothetical protein
MQRRMSVFGIRPSAATAGRRIRHVVNIALWIVAILAAIAFIARAEVPTP